MILTKNRNQIKNPIGGGKCIPVGKSDYRFIVLRRGKCIWVGKSDYRFIVLRWGKCIWVGKSGYRFIVLRRGGVNVFQLVSQATGSLSFGGGNVFWLVSQATGLLSFGGGEGVKSEVNIKNVGWVKPNINYICKSYRDSLGSRPLNEMTAHLKVLPTCWMSLRGAGATRQSICYGWVKIQPAFFNCQIPSGLLRAE